jgi:hypothetical protein
MVTSIGFEILEYSLEHQLPNFSECWWDHVGHLHSFKKDYSYSISSSGSLMLLFVMVAAFI